MRSTPAATNTTDERRPLSVWHETVSYMRDLADELSSLADRHPYRVGVRAVPRECHVGAALNEGIKTTRPNELTENMRYRRRAARSPVEPCPSRVTTCS